MRRDRWRRLQVARLCAKTLFFAIAVASTAMYIHCLVTGQWSRFGWWLLADCAAVGIEILL